MPPSPRAPRSQISAPEPPLSTPPDQPAASRAPSLDTLAVLLAFLLAALVRLGLLKSIPW